MRRILDTLLIVLVAFPLFAGGRRSTQPQIPQLGVSLSGNPQLTLDQAVAIARANDPTLTVARLGTERAGAVAREASGMFDDSIEVEFTGEFLRGELLPPVQKQQITQREIFNMFATIFQRVSDDLLRNLEDPNFNTIPCSDDLPEGSEIVIRDADGNETVIRCTPDDTPTPLDEIFEIIIGSGNNPGLDEVLRVYRDFNNTNAREEIEKIARILAENAKNFREQLRLFGAVPFMQERLHMTLGGGYRFNLRNGMSWGLGVGLETIEENYVAKSQNPVLGGRGPAGFRSAAAVELNVPFGRGGGVGVADALERSANLNYTASLAGVKHAETDTVLRTALAFWNLLAAQERIDEAEDAAKRSERLLAIGAELVKGGEVARADLNQLYAQAGDRRRTFVQSRLALRQAQLDLATTIGLRVEGPDDFPVAIGTLPEVAPPETLRAIPLDTLVSAALEKRYDIAEAFARIDAAASLTYAARKSLAPKVDLNFVLYYESRAEDFSYTRGLKHAISGNWIGPSATLTLDVELPVRNLTQIGQFRQALSIQHQGEIQARDLQRTTRGRVVEIWGSLIESSEVVARVRNTERMYRQAIQDQRTKFERGEGTVLDSVFIEEQLAATQLQLVEAKLDWALLLAQLRYETGTIADPTFGDTMADVIGTLPVISENGSSDDAVSRFASGLKNLDKGQLPPSQAARR